MDLKELQVHLESDLEKQCVSPSVLLDRLRVVDEACRKSSAYVDPTYVPFFYYLGKYLKPINLVEIGFNLGFCSTCFLKSCNTVKKIVVFQEQTKEYYSSKFGIKNIKSLHRGDFIFVDNKLNLEPVLDKNQWQLALFNIETDYDKSLFLLDTIWKNLDFDGYIVVDHVKSNENIQKVFDVFCKMKNREPIFISTRYGVGIVQR